MFEHMLDRDDLQPERPRPLRRTEYDRLVEAGVFADERVELLRGVLVTMSPQGNAQTRVSPFFERAGRAATARSDRSLGPSKLR